MTGETEDDTYSDTQLEVLLDEVGGDLNLAASRIWGEKASDYADLVNITEAGSSRSNSDLFKHAREQSDYYNSISGDGVVASTTASTTRRIERM
jgi:hypothetical protein